jgi:Family of unknown function (DUF6267)
MNLFEGGNVFKDANGRALTQRINQADVEPTVVWLEQLTGLDLHGELDPEYADSQHPEGYPEKWLGSTGKKSTSGDLDLDSSDTTKDQLVARLVQWCVSHGFKPEDYVVPKAIVHFKTPIDGRPDRGYVQTDFTFLPDPAWGRFVLGGTSDQYKGRERNVLMNSIAKSMGYKLNQNAGIADRTTNKLITNDPDRTAKLLLNPRATRADLRNVETILKALEKDPKRDQKLADFREHMKREGIPFMENVDANPYIEYNEVNFLARLRDRIVNQGMQKLIESEVQGGRAKGLEHLEDYVFRNGSAGIKRAMDIVRHTAADTKSTTTVKWDGKPALVFGRDPSGTFILTDVAGFGAKGYNGLFTSPRQVYDLLAARDADAQAKGLRATRIKELYPIYQKLWPLLDAAVPQDYRGFFQGDLLYTQTPPLKTGLYVFQPNEIEYRIPADSDVGKRIGASQVGIAMHTRYAEPGAPKEPIGNFKFNPVEGLLLLEPVYAKKNILPDSDTLKELSTIYSTHGAAIDQLFDPAELRALQITDLPKLCIDYINSRVGSDFSDLAEGFGEWLQRTQTSRKYANIYEYLTSPRSNVTGLEKAFDAWSLLHDIKMDVLQQLDLQHPGQEGWVMATPAGMGKAVNRMAGGFTAANRARNNPNP